MREHLQHASRDRTRRVASLVALCAALAPSVAIADPPVARWTPSLAAALHTRTRGDTQLGAAFDLRGEVFFGRDSRAVRLGLLLEGRAMTIGELAAGAGLSLALPLGRSDSSPTLTLTAGGALHDRESLDPAAFGRVWFGLRTEIDSSTPYEIAFGLWAETRWFPRDGTVDALVGVSVDFWAMSLPVVYLASAFSRR